MRIVRPSARTMKGRKDVDVADASAKACSAFDDDVPLCCDDAVPSIAAPPNARAVTALRTAPITHDSQSPRRTARDPLRLQENRHDAAANDFFQPMLEIWPLHFVLARDGAALHSRPP